MGITPLSSSQLSELRQFGQNLDRSTPLWYYILKEAEVAGGARLAGVGARIVAEVFLGLLMKDPDSYLNRARVAAQPAQPDARHVHDGRSADVCRRRSGEPTPIAVAVSRGGAGRPTPPRHILGIQARRRTRRDIRARPA